jgi:signal transduction histidine kinase
VLAPTGRDAALACEVLRGAGMLAEACADAAAVVAALETGAGALLLTEEALTPQTLALLSGALARQPPWSDLPILIFAGQVSSQASTARLQQMLDVLGNVTFIDRPVRVPTLLTAVRAALRARQRQYGARELLEELRRAEEEARARADFEQQLIGIVSHDLRNPLNAMLLSASALLRREDTDARSLRALSRIVSSGERATRLVRDLLDFTQARLGNGIPLQRRPMNLHQVARGVVEEVRAAHPERDLRLETEGDGEGLWDPDRLAQVLTNLASNAVAYSPAESAIRVRVRGGVRGGEASLEVHNGGPPIPAALQPQLFEPYRRGEGPGDAGSIGLGLFIVCQVVRAHGGRVEVHSTEADGTTFRVHLPRG